MDYKQAIDYLFNQLPVFQNKGAGAYKPGLDTVTALSAMFGEPHKRLKTIHVAGTNGKGSTAHTLAAVLQSAGYKTGLFTSPHLLDFRERIRINGEMIGEDEVTTFVGSYLSRADGLQPSFFELTTVMAFDHFARHGVDIAVIEVGLGGRLDSTNIITPLLSVITNISLDHTALLGNTIELIAGEKAGIIKPGVPVVIGEDSGVRDVFSAKAGETGSEIIFAEDRAMFDGVVKTPLSITYKSTPWGDIEGELTGDCQTKNTATILTALKKLSELGVKFTAGDVRRGFASVCSLTGLTGRWFKVSDEPLTICDTGHNPGGWQYLSQQLRDVESRLQMVIGFVNDKDVSSILGMMPGDARYYFVRPSVERGLDANTLKDKAMAHGLEGRAFDSVAEGYEKALSEAEEGDMIFVGGSTFVVADLLTLLKS